MGSNENDLDNSIESALSMSQEEIERLLNGYEQNNEEQLDFGGEDLASLLSELEAADDEDIQEISDLLDKAENNEAADAGIEQLMREQEEVGEIPAYAAADLFSATEAETQPKKGFLQRIIEKFKKPHSDKKKEDAEVSQDKDEKEQLLWDEALEQSEQSESVDIIQASEEALNGSDAIIFELEKDEIAKQEEEDKIKPKKEKKSKKKAKKDKKDKEVPEGEEAEEGKKKKKDKKPKEKKVKEKKVKVKTVDFTELEDSESVSKKKTMVIFFICLMLMFALVAIIVNYSGHANRRLAQEAYEQGDYLECYQMLYGQHMDESQQVMFHKSEITLKMDLFWNRYESYVSQGKLLEGLDKLIQFEVEYPDLREYAAEWNCENIVEQSHTNVLNELYEEYRLEEQDALDIANIESDIDYTRKLMDLVEKKEQGVLKYPNMLPEEEERIIQTGGQDDSNN